MKKLLFLTLITSVVFATTTNAQTGSGPAPTSQQTKELVDPAVMLQQTKDKISPLMVEKTGLTKAQADKVIEILFEMRQSAGALGNLSAEDRSKKLAELKADKDKKFSELLTAEQIASVKTFYEEMGKNNQQKAGH
jgi:Spy/CpxP family protein refolding chaperone